MKFTYAVAAALSILITLVYFSAGAMSFPPPDNQVQLHGKLNTTCFPNRGGIAYLQMEVTTPEATRSIRERRCPMNITVVLDRSGSMAEEGKLENAKAAIMSLVDRLSKDDYFGIVIYDDQIETILPIQRLREKSHIRRLLQEIYPRGATNLGGGLTEGFRQIEQNYKREYVNRVILLSDGLANRGITDRSELDRLTEQYRNRSISLSTIGVGLDYDENLMLGLADHGGGNYYFVETPRQLASIFEHELNGLNNVFAKNGEIVLTPGRGVSLADVIGCKWRMDGDRWILPVGDLLSNDHREFTVELNVPEGAGTQRLASGVLRYESLSGTRTSCSGFAVDIHYSEDAAELLRGNEWDTRAKADVALSTRKVERAMEALDAGRPEEAAKELSEAKGMLQASPAMTNSPQGAAVMQDQIRRLDEYEKDVNDGGADARKVKKSIQFKNYIQQKKGK